LSPPESTIAHIIASTLSSVSGDGIHIEAAGGVVWRVGDHGDVEVLLIHRPRYGDWSLPKGKLEGNESVLQCALREVREETGMRCDIGPMVSEIVYLDRKGRRKRVSYWAMQAVEGRFSPNREVDKVRWMTVDAAIAKLSYNYDVPVVCGLATVMADI
jgi:8-oxo-dGTP diphosphatase